MSQSRVASFSNKEGLSKNIEYFKKITIKRQEQYKAQMKGREIYKWSSNYRSSSKKTRKVT